MENDDVSDKFHNLLDEAMEAERKGDIAYKETIKNPTTLIS